jgi:hypothetical protein
VLAYAQPVICSVDLGPHRNNVGITAAAATGAGRLNVWRNSLPAAELPVGARVTVGGVPFDFPDAGGGEPDNVRCEGQLLAVPSGRYDWLYLLVTAERRVEDEIAFHFACGAVDHEPLRVSDFWAAAAAFGDSQAFATSAMHYPHHVQPGVPGMIWCQRVPVTRRAELVAARLPLNVAVHIFAATLYGPDGAQA